jgi:hypothetical protein
MAFNYPERYDSWFKRQIILKFGCNKNAAINNL